MSLEQTTIPRRFECASGDGTILAVDLDADESGDICVAISGSRGQYFVADATSARGIAKALTYFADAVEGSNS